VFLSHENCLALVNIYDGENHSFGDILHSFTVHTTILRVLETNVLIAPHIQSRDNLLEGDCFVWACIKTCETEAQKTIILYGDRTEEPERKPKKKIEKILKNRNETKWKNSVTYPKNVDECSFP